MMGQELLRKLIIRAPPDLLAAIYERSRRSTEVKEEGPSWQEIVCAAQALEIFTAEESLAFLQIVADLSRNSAGGERQNSIRSGGA